MKRIWFLLSFLCVISFSLSAQTKKEPLFGKSHSSYKVTSSSLKGAVFYLVSGHGGPDPGCIGKYQGKELHEDEYAYDIILRLGKELLERGAKVYFIIQDAKDGIRDSYILKNSKRETCMGKPIPLNQIERLKQRCVAINNLYRKDKSSYKRAIFIHVDSRSRSKQTDVYFYHAPNSRIRAVISVLYLFTLTAVQEASRQTYIFTMPRTAHTANVLQQKFKRLSKVNTENISPVEDLVEQ